MARIPLQVASRQLETGPMVNYGGVASSPVGRAVEGFGAQITDAAQRYQQQIEETENFETMQGLDRMELAAQNDLVEVQQNTPESALGYHDNSVAAFDKRSQEFLANVPERLKPRLNEVLQTKRMEFSQRQAGVELEQRNAWYRTGVTEKQEQLQTAVFNDPAAFDSAREEGLLAIDASGLPEIEKAALRDAWDDTLALTIGEREIRDAEASPDSANDAASRLGVGGTRGSGVEQFVDQIIQVESGGKSNAKNPNSSATGPGQFLNSTWMATVRKHRPDLLQGRSEAQVLALRTDPALAREMTTAYASDNAALLASRGFDGSAGNIYLAHFLGPAGASQVLGARPGTPIENIVGPEVIRANGFLRGKSASDVIAWSDKKMGGEGSVARTPTDPRYANLSLAQRLEIYDKTQSAAQRGRTAIGAQQKAEYDARKGALELGIETGDVSSPLQIAQAGLTDAHTADLLRTLRSRQGDEANIAAAVAAFQSGNLAVDPYSTDGKKTVDGVYGALSKAVPEDQLQGVTEDLIATGGVVPSAYHNRIRAGLESTNPADVEFAAQQASRISQISPAILGRREGGAEIQRKADDFNYMVNTLNMTPAQASQRIADMNDPDKRRARTALEPAAKEFRKQMENEDIGAMFDDSVLGWRSNPEVGFSEMQRAGIQAEYLAIAEEQFYLANGNPDLAKNRANEEMKRLYGTTSISGRSVVMKHPPDRYWPEMPGGDPYGYAIDQIAEEFSQYIADEDVSGWFPTDAARNAALPDRKKQMVRDSLVVISTPETDAMVKAGQLPAYFVGYQDANGVLQTIPGKLFQPDVSVVGAERQRLVDEEVNAARQIEADMQFIDAEAQAAEQEQPIIGLGVADQPTMLDPISVSPDAVPDMRPSVGERITPQGVLQNAQQRSRKFRESR